MKYILALLATGALFLTSGCGGDDKGSIDDQKIAAIHKSAPSWTYTSDRQILQEMAHICTGTMIDRPAQVTEYDYEYLVGLSMSTCGK